MLLAPKMRNSPLVLGSLTFAVLFAISLIDQTTSLVIGALVMVAVLVRLATLGR
jgi:hypothetical protein